VGAVVAAVVVVVVEMCQGRMTRRFLRMGNGNDVTVHDASEDMTVRRMQMMVIEFDCT
jgi:hypothetical protein